jgi:putative Mn2+ efflux pump MntP
MAFFEILMISLGFGADAFSVALASGAQGFGPRRIFRLSWHFGLFQFLMPIIGWYAGDLLSREIGQFGQWIVLLLLFTIGSKMICEGFKNDISDPPDLSRGWKLISLSIGTSLDALGVGFGLGLIGITVFKPALIIGIVCAAMTIIGLYLGVCLYRRLKNQALIIGGLILVALGVKMVI